MGQRGHVVLRAVTNVWVRIYATESRARAVLRRKGRLRQAGKSVIHALRVGVSRLYQCPGRADPSETYVVCCYRGTSANQRQPRLPEEVVLRAINLDMAVIGVPGKQ